MDRLIEYEYAIPLRQRMLIQPGLPLQLPSLSRLFPLSRPSHPSPGLHRYPAQTKRTSPGRWPLALTNQ